MFCRITNTDSWTHLMLQQSVSACSPHTHTHTRHTSALQITVLNIESRYNDRVISAHSSTSARVCWAAILWPLSLDLYATIITFINSIIKPHGQSLGHPLRARMVPPEQIWILPESDNMSDVMLGNHVSGCRDVLSFARNENGMKRVAREHKASFSDGFTRNAWYGCHGYILYMSEIKSCCWSILND